MSPTKTKRSPTKTKRSPAKTKRSPAKTKSPTNKNILNETETRILDNFFKNFTKQNLTKQSLTKILEEKLPNRLLNDDEKELLLLDNIKDLYKGIKPDQKKMIFELFKNLTVEPSKISFFSPKSPRRRSKSSPIEKTCVICTEDYNDENHEKKQLDCCKNYICKSCLYKLPLISDEEWLSDATGKILPSVKCPFCRSLRLKEYPPKPKPNIIVRAPNYTGNHLTDLIINNIIIILLIYLLDLYNGRPPSFINLSDRNIAFVFATILWEICKFFL